jgi:thioredoxin 1
MFPVIERIVNDHQLELVNVDVNDSQEVATEQSVQSLPTVMLFENGQPAGTAVGPMPRARLVQRLGLGGLDGA